MIKAINIVRGYVDNINDRINMVYLKIPPVKKTDNYGDIDYSLPPEYYHTIFYSDLDKINISSDVANQFRNLMKDIRLFNDKFEYITKKNENFDKMAQEYKNFKLSNKFEDLSSLSELDINDVKDKAVQNIFKNFNMARENFEGLMKDLKFGLTSDKVHVYIYIILD